MSDESRVVFSAASGIVAGLTADYLADGWLSVVLAVLLAVGLVSLIRAVSSEPVKHDDAGPLA